MMKKLLEAMSRFAGEPEQKPGEQWKGTDKGTPGKKLVGDSIIKDLSKGVTPKTKEEELAEAFANFNEDDLGVEPKRPGRKSDRPGREYTKQGKPSNRYKKINEYKKDADNFTSDDIKELEGIRDLATLKARAFALISKPSARPMKPEKVQWFKNRLDSLVSPMAVIKLMYDLLLSGEGQRVIGSRSSMGANSYRSRFSEGWNTGSDRVNLPDGPMTYWNGTGRLQNEYNELYEKLVPSQGAAETIEGEVLRASSKIVYRHFNDGDLFNQASFDQLEQYIGRVANYDDLAEKAIEFALKAQGNYHPNTGWDSLDVMDYGPEEEEEYDDEEDDDSWDHDDDEDLLGEGAADIYSITSERNGRERSKSGTLAELIEYYGYTLETGQSYERERGNRKINLNPKSIESLVQNLNNAKSNAAANGQSNERFYVDHGNMAEGKHFRTAYGWAGGRNEKTGKMYKHPDQIKADREAKKAVAKDAFNDMFGGDAEDLTRNLKIKEAGMPSSVIKHKQALASKTPEALYAGFKQVADKQGKSVESLARSAAWRHGYGKGNGQGSAHYWDKIKHLGETVSEADMFKAGQRAIKNIKSTTQQRKSEAEKMAIAQAQIDADRENERDRFSQEELYPSDDSHDLDEGADLTLFNLDRALSRYNMEKKSENPDPIRIAQLKKIIIKYKEDLNTKKYGHSEDFINPNYDSKTGKWAHSGIKRPVTMDEGWEADLAKTNRERMKKERAAAKPMAPIAKAKPNYDRVMFDIETAIGDSFPDGDPMDTLMRKYRDSYGDLNIDLLNKACRVNGAKSYHDYVAKVWQQHMQDNPDLVQGGNPWVAEGEVSTRKYEMMLRNGQVKKFVAKDDADAKRIAAGHGAKSVIRMKGNVPGNKIAENDHPRHYVDRYNKDLERKIDKDFDPDYDRKMSDQEFEAKLKQRGKERDQSRINLDEEEIPDQSGIYITGQQGEYIDGPFDDLRSVRHEWDLHPEYYKKAHKEELTHEEAWERFGIAEGLVKDIKRLATGKDVKSRAGQEIAKSQDASMKGDTKTSKKHFDRFVKLDKLANKEQGVAEGWESGPEERTTRERDPDAEYDARRQEKLDAEADKAPKTTTYQCVGRGPNDEPNYKFGPEHNTSEEAVAYRKKLMANPKTPNPRDIGIRTISKVAKGINEDITSSDPLEGALLDAIHELIGQGHTDVDPMVLTNMVVAATSQPFLLKDLVDANNNSQAVQHYIDSISPSKVKFSSDMLTVKNEDPAKDKAKAQAGVSSMASRAANRNRLGEGTETPLRDKEDYNAKRKALQQIQMTPGTEKDPQLKAELARRLASLNQQYSTLHEQISKFKESRGHKVIATKLGNMDRMQNVQVPSPAERQEQLRIAKEKEQAGKKQVKEFAAPGMNPATPVATNTAAKPDPATVAKAAAATNTLKAATGTVVAPATLDKALDSATQGTATSTDVKALAPIMDVVNKAASDPKLAAQFKNLANQAKTTP